MNNAKLHSSYTKLTASISWRMGLRHDEQWAYVYVVTPEKTAQLRRVKLVDIEGDKAVILENLALNDVVALEGFDKLHEGSHVDIAQKDGQSVAPTPDNQLTSNNKAHKTPAEGIDCLINDWHFVSNMIKFLTDRIS